MPQIFRIALVMVALVIAAFGLVAGRATTAQARSSKAAGKTATPASPPKAVNACGCYTDSAGHCFCGKKGKCVCPGECEPKGCEEKRAKELEKEVANETKKAADAQKNNRVMKTDTKPDPGAAKTKAKSKKAEKPEKPAPRDTSGQ